MTTSLESKQRSSSGSKHKRARRARWRVERRWENQGINLSNAVTKDMGLSPEQSKAWEEASRERLREKDDLQSPGAQIERGEDVGPVRRLQRQALTGRFLRGPNLACVTAWGHLLLVPGPLNEVHEAGRGRSILLEEDAILLVSDLGETAGGVARAGEAETA